MRTSGLAVYVCALVAFASAAKFPEQYTKCKKGSPDISQCLVNNIVNGIKFIHEHKGDPKYKLKDPNPLDVKEIELQATPQLRIKLTNVKFYGLDTISAREATFTDDNTSGFKGHLDKIVMIGNYEMNGNILVLPIRGEGDCNITIVDCDLEYKTNLVTEERKGKTYFKALNEKTSFDLSNPKRVYLQFSNLFNGDKRLGEEMNRFLDENWKEIYKEIQSAFEQTAAFSIINYYVNGYFQQIPADTLID